jgi:tetratricopeptide (TPR) repeat protein
MGLFGFGKSNDEKFRDWVNKGASLNSLEKYKEAITCCNEAIQLDPKNSIPWNNKVYSLRKLGRYEEAEQCFAKAKELSDPSSECYSIHRHYLRNKKLDK